MNREKIHPEKIIVMPMLAYRGNILKFVTVRRNILWASMDNNPKAIRSTKQRIQSARKERITLVLNEIKLKTYFLSMPLAPLGSSSE